MIDKEKKQIHRDIKKYALHIRLWELYNAAGIFKNDAINHKIKATAILSKYETKDVHKTN